MGSNFVAVGLLGALLFPALGPLVDHHYAEHSPGHKHLSPLGYHPHTYSNQTDHSHSREGASETGDSRVALVNYEGGALSVAAFDGKTALQSLLQFEPSSLLPLASAVESRTKDRYPSPPFKPPRYSL